MSTYQLCRSTIYVIKLNIHSIRKIEEFVETHICKLCVMLRSRVLLGVSSSRIQVGDSPWNYTVACTRVNRVMIINLCEETIKPVSEGDKI